MADDGVVRGIDDPPPYDGPHWQDPEDDTIYGTDDLPPCCPPGRNPHRGWDYDTPLG